MRNVFVIATVITIALSITPPAEAAVTPSFLGLGYHEVPSGGYMYSSVYGVSADGSVVIGRSEVNRSSTAYRWTADGGMVDIGASHLNAKAVSADGSTIVGDRNHYAIRLTASGIEDLWASGTASGVSANGAVVVGMFSLRALIARHIAGQQARGR